LPWLQAQIIADAKTPQKAYISLYNEILTAEIKNRLDLLGIDLLKMLNSQQNARNKAFYDSSLL
jgi:hypothetical protein